MLTTLILISLSLMLLSTWLAFTVAAITPPARNILYIHIPAAAAALVCFLVLFTCSIQYLRTKKSFWDRAAASSAQVGLLFATALNLAAMLFARAEWGIFWSPSMRLITSAALWFLYLAYLLLRGCFESSHQKAAVASVFAIIAFVDVPLVFISARFVRDIHRASFRFDNPAQYIALISGLLGTLLLASVLICLQSRLLEIDEKLNNLLLKGT